MAILLHVSVRMDAGILELVDKLAEKEYGNNRSKAINALLANALVPDAKDELIAELQNDLASLKRDVGSLKEMAQRNGIEI